MSSMIPISVSDKELERRRSPDKAHLVTNAWYINRRRSGVIELIFPVWPIKYYIGIRQRVPEIIQNRLEINTIISRPGIIQSIISQCRQTVSVAEMVFDRIYHVNDMIHIVVNDGDRL